LSGNDLVQRRSVGKRWQVASGEEKRLRARGNARSVNNTYTMALLARSMPDIKPTISSSVEDGYSDDAIIRQTEVEPTHHFSLGRVASRRKANVRRAPCVPTARAQRASLIVRAA